MKLPAFLAALLMTASLRANLSNPNLSGPGTVTGGSTYSLILSVQNGPGQPTVSNISGSLVFSSWGFSPTILSTPVAVASLAASSSATFTWTFSGDGCGSADFTATVSGTENSSPVSSAPASHEVTLYCTPTPTPTATPNWTATPTPWIVEVPPPASGSAEIRGNLFRPLLGEPLMLEAFLPEASALSVEIFDRLGHKVKGFSLNASAGPVSLAWDGRSDDGLLVSSGIYVAQFRARNLDRRVKLAVLK